MLPSPGTDDAELRAAPEPSLVWVVLLVCWGCWALGIFLPIVEVTPFPRFAQGSSGIMSVPVTEKLESSTLETLRLLHSSGYILPFVILLVCSVFVPLTKLTVMSAVLWMNRFSPNKRVVWLHKVLAALTSIGSYQLVDLFMGFLFVAFLNSACVGAHLRAGFTIFGVYCILSQALLLTLEGAAARPAAAEASVASVPPSDPLLGRGAGGGDSERGFVGANAAAPLAVEVVHLDKKQAWMNGTALVFLILAGFQEPMLDSAVTLHGIALCRSTLRLDEIATKAAETSGFAGPCLMVLVFVSVVVVPLVVSVCAYLGHARLVSLMAPWVMTDVFSLSLITFLFTVQSSNLQTFVPNGTLFGIESEWFSGFYVGLGLGAAGFSLKWNLIRVEYHTAVDHHYVAESENIGNVMNESSCCLEIGAVAPNGGEEVSYARVATCEEEMGGVPQPAQHPVHGATGKDEDDAEDAPLLEHGPPQSHGEGDDGVGCPAGCDAEGPVAAATTQEAAASATSFPGAAAAPTGAEAVAAGHGSDAAAEVVEADPQDASDMLVGIEGNAHAGGGGGAAAARSTSGASDGVVDGVGAVAMSPTASLDLGGVAEPLSEGVAAAGKSSEEDFVCPTPVHAEVAQTDPASVPVDASSAAVPSVPSKSIALFADTEPAASSCLGSRSPRFAANDESQPPKAQPNRLGKLLRNPVVRVKAASWIIWGLCFFCVRAPARLSFMRITHALEGIAPVLNRGARMSLPASIGDCIGSSDDAAKQSPPPEPCIGYAPLHSGRSGTFDVLVRWATGINTIRLEGFSIHVIPDSPKPLQIFISGSIANLRMSIRIMECILFACRTLWDNAEGCCEPDRKFELVFATDCSDGAEGAKLGSFKVEWFNIDEISLTEDVFGIPKGIADLTPDVRDAVRGAASEVLEGRTLLMDLSFAEIVSTLWKNNAGGGGTTCGDLFGSI